MSLDCLNNVIGLSKTACTCWDSTKPVDFNTLNQSSSGLYVSQPDTIPIRWTNSAADCENGGVWDLIIQARDQAVRDLLQDFLAETQRVKEVKFLPFTQIGDNYFKQAQIVKDNVAGIWLEPYEIRGGNLIIKSVDIAFWSGIVGPTDVDISIYSSLDLTNPIDTATATVTANKQFFTATYASPVIIDLGNIREDLNEKIYILYTIPAGAIPVKNNITKGCSCHNRESRQSYYNNPFLQILCSEGGVQTDSVLNVDSSPVFGTGTMNGLVINSSLECDYYTWLCDLAQQPNSTSILSGQRLSLGMGLADGLQAKAVYNLADSILMSGRINHYTMVLDPKQLYVIKNKAIKEYMLAIKNLVYYMPADVSDCLKCAPDKRMVKSSILV